ncbi:MAG: ATP-binding protein, partial [Candidatus Cloacimonadota bacterium]|nr:ATP-binding protein [Candidatus Cloacimonadota bacterium]
YRIDIQLNLVKKLPKVFGNIYKLEQVLLNLLSNSKDALLDIDNKRLIKISTNLIDDSIQIVFCDNGDGIPAEIIQKIFIPFYTTKDPGKGTGLGLSITFGIINNMNGSIIIDENYTTGTQFIIKIPISNKMEK